VCSAAGCENRYTHANRQCPDHPFAKPQRTTEIILQPNISANEDRDQVLRWLQKYRREREEKTPGKLGSSGSGSVPNEEEEGANYLPHNEFYLPTKNLKSKRGLMKEMDQTLGQENCLLVAARSEAGAVGSSSVQTTSRPPPVVLTAQESFNQALRRAGELLDRSAAPGAAAAYPHPQHLLLYPPAKGVENSPQHAAVLGRAAMTLASTATVGSCSPSKRRQFSCDLVSPMKSIRRTLGDITPTKNCRADPADLELPFNFGILQTSPPELAGRCLMLPPTPSSSEKSPHYPQGGSSGSGSLFGSPALKLKKRFQERFQEERLTSGTSETSGDFFADPIAWHEDDEDDYEVARLAKNNIKSVGPGRFSINESSLLSPPPRSTVAGREGSPTLLVATALVELYESPSRQNSTSQEIPLNLTKRSYY
jgi:hypothetical protein